jgi:hypothetical protein
MIGGEWLQRMIFHAERYVRRTVVRFENEDLERAVVEQEGRG